MRKSGAPVARLMVAPRIVMLLVITGKPFGPAKTPATSLSTALSMNVPGALMMSAPEPAAQASTGASVLAAVIASRNEQFPLTTLSTAPGVTLIVAASAGDANIMTRA